MVNNKISSTLTQMQKEIEKIQQDHLIYTGLAVEECDHPLCQDQEDINFILAKKEAYLACLSDVLEIIDNLEGYVAPCEFCDTVTGLDDENITEGFKQRLKEQLEVKS